MTSAINEPQFAHITTYGKELVPTDYADGYNVGTVVDYNVGYTMSLPKFALIIRRTPKMIETVVLPTTKRGTDGYGQQGYEKPVARVYVPEGVRGVRSRMGKHGFNVNGHLTHIWGGDEKWFDHMD